MIQNSVYLVELIICVIAATFFFILSYRLEKGDSKAWYITAAIGVISAVEAVVSVVQLIM